MPGSPIQNNMFEATISSDNFNATKWLLPVPQVKATLSLAVTAGS